MQRATCNSEIKLKKNEKKQTRTKNRENRDLVHIHYKTRLPPTFNAQEFLSPIST